MADIRVGNGSFFAQGLDGISHLAVSDLAGLPELRDLTPAEQAQRPQLDELLALPNMASFLEQSVRPELSDPEMLVPVNFLRAHETALQHLEQAIEAARISDPEGAKVLGRAARVMYDERDLRNLLSDNRSALHKG